MWMKKIVFTGLLFPLLAFVGCNGFSNGELEAAHHEAAAAAEAADKMVPSAVQDQPRPITIMSDSPGLPESRYGAPYAVQFMSESGESLCWRVEEGQLPKGLSLDTKTGLLSGRVEEAEAGYSQFRVSAYGPCEVTPVYAHGESQDFFLTYHGKCLWDQDCAVDETCREDGTCRKEVETSCKSPVQANVRLEPVPAVKAGSLIEVTGGRVVFNGIPPEDSLCPLGDKMLVLSPGENHTRTFCYRLPGELSIPVSEGEEIDFRLMLGLYEDRYVMLRATTETQGWRWAAYSGHLDSARLWSQLCGTHKDCPFLSQTSFVLLSGCENRGQCAPTPAGIRIKTQARVLLPGQQAPWGLGSNGEALYQVYLADAYVKERCHHDRLAGGMTYLLLEGSMPHPLIDIARDEVLLREIPTRVSFGGEGSIAAALNADDSSYIHEYLWTDQVPEGNPRTQRVENGANHSIDAYVVGPYLAGLEVKDGKTSLTSREPATARVLVRPSSALHVEVTWKDASENVDLHLSPPEASGGWGHSMYPPLTEALDPAWARQGSQTVATITAQPDQKTVEVLEADGALVSNGAYLLGVDQAVGATKALQATIRVYLYGKSFPGGTFHVTVPPDTFVPLASIDILDGQLVSLLP